MSAPELSPAEAAKVAEFDAAPDAKESLRERVARALCEEQNPTTSWPWVPDGVRDVFRTCADRAIAVVRGDDA